MQVVFLSCTSYLSIWAGVTKTGLNPVQMNEIWAKFCLGGKLTASEKRIKYRSAFNCILSLVMYTNQQHNPMMTTENFFSSLNRFMLTAEQMHQWVFTLSLFSGHLSSCLWHFTVILHVHSCGSTHLC
jgi:hypothetical protein